MFVQQPGLAAKQRSQAYITVRRQQTILYRNYTCYREMAQLKTWTCSLFERPRQTHTHTQITLAKVEAAGWETQGLWDWQNMRRMNLTRHQRGFYVVESGDENLKQMLHPTHSISFLRFMLIHTYYKECNVNMDPPCLLYVYTCVFDYAPWVSKLLCTDVLRGECNDGCFQPTL